MCPGCLASAAVMVASAMSAGGLTALAAKWRSRKKAVNKPKAVNSEEER